MLHYQPRSPQCRQIREQSGPEVAAPAARLGLVVGKKLLKRAVDRNRLKRVVRENFRLRRLQLPSYDLVVRLAVKGVPLHDAELATEINALFDRLAVRHRRQLEIAAQTVEQQVAATSRDLP